VRRLAVLGALAVVAGLGLTAAGSGAAPRAELQVVSTEPFRIRGTGFRSYERVSVTATVDGERSVLERRAGRRGRFWALLADDACSATVRAVGRQGSKAGLAFDHVTCPPTP
jgi:hypothetical protein